MLPLAVGICTLIFMLAISRYIARLILWLFPIYFVGSSSHKIQTSTLGSDTVGFVCFAYYDGEKIQNPSDTLGLIPWGKFRFVYDIIADNPVHFPLMYIDRLILGRQNGNLVTVKFGNRGRNSSLYVDVSKLESKLDSGAYAVILVSSVLVMLVVNFLV